MYIYLFLDLLQLTDKLGGVQASCESNKGRDSKNTKVTSHSESIETDIISPLRPATRSQKVSRVRLPVSASKTESNKRKAIKLEEKVEQFRNEDIQVMTGIDEFDVFLY